MTLSHCPLASLLVLALMAGPALAIKSGDVVVIRQDAQLKISGKVVGQVKAGEVSRVHGVRGTWVEVGDTTKGWVRTDNVMSESEGLEHVSKLIAATPDDVSLWITRARMRMSTQGIREPERAKRLEAAEADLNEAKKRSPDSADVRYYQALIAARRNEVDQALAKLNEAIVQNPKDARLYLERARLLFQRNRRREAMQDFEQVVALKEADANTYNNLAWWYATSLDSTVRDGAKAVKYATEACELTNYNNYAYVDTLAAAYAESGDFPSAMRWQDEAIELCNNPGEKRGLEARAKQYRLKEPYREYGP